MRTITIKGLPGDVYRRLKESAGRHRRSINSEAIVCLERALGNRRIAPEEFLARADALRDRLALPPATEDALREAKADGRP